MTMFDAPRRGLLRPAVAVALVSCVIAVPTLAQSAGTVPIEGVQERPSRHVLLTHARIVLEPGKTITDGSIELRDGRIVSVQAGTRDAPGTSVRDLGGKTVYAGFIDAAARVGVPDDMRAGAIKPFPPGQPPHQTTLDQSGTHYWNRRVRPEWSVAVRLDYKPDEAKALRALGFTAAYAVPEAGVVKGQGALVSLRDTSVEKDVLLNAETAQHFGFELAGGFSGEYPGSLMGAIALIRQSLYDARWQAARTPNERTDANAALTALAPAARGAQRAWFQLDDELDLQRVTHVAREFDLQPVLIGSGYEYRVLEQARAAQAPFVLSLNYPETPNVEDAEATLNTSLAELQHWEQAPANAARLVDAGIAIALSARGLKEPDKKFWSAVRRTVKAGLSEDAALRALTTTPAQLIGAVDKFGRIAPGQFANLVVADADLFRNDNATIYETWVEGERFELKSLTAAKGAGQWQLQWADGKGPTSFKLQGEGETLDANAGSIKFKAKLAGETLTILPPATLFGEKSGKARITATLRGDTIEGYRDLVDGRRVRFTGTRSGTEAATAKTSATEAPAAIPAQRGYPAGEFARATLPPQPKALLIRNATIWTNTDDGVLREADVLVKQGRIVAVGANLSAPSDAIVVDAEGQHLTPGIIDAHSHTAIARNVNEPSHAVTTEVRVGDVLDPTDIDIYRQLAGGVTSANLLHGSANPMGGQNAVIKLRWGADADGLRFAGAPTGVKFALGENVKQSGWGDAFNTRYPQTRMGVEQVMRDAFNAARDYAMTRSGKNSERVRRDLRLEALAEILAGERLVHVHSYRQDEILMFARLAKDYALPVATFQHVLEGYKAADAIAEIGAGGSTFADWWAYKMEVLDAIPQNGALMTRAGVLTSFNSDSNEMARRLNMEAAKAMRYGGLDEQEALKLVTLNPAKQLRIDDRVGAIREGLDADMVLWSDHPLSNFARAEQTWIDGRRYFDRDEDRALQAQSAVDRERLIQKALEERAKTLALSMDARKDGAKKVEKTEPDPELVEAIRADRDGWIESHATERALYHNGADLMSCTLNDHAH